MKYNETPFNVPVASIHSQINNWSVGGMPHSSALKIWASYNVLHYRYSQCCSIWDKPEYSRKRFHEFTHHTLLLSETIPGTGIPSYIHKLFLVLWTCVYSWYMASQLVSVQEFTHPTSATELLMAIGNPGSLLVSVCHA